ncbi:MAG TPA: hypothetical protein VMW38_28395 [Terriglobia bacterium]|nr:hypothetical protein [Terriglobia bacterium]
MRNLLWILVVAMWLGFPAAANYRWPTLAETLAENHVPATGLAPAVLNQQITSFSTLNDASQFVVAYYVYQDSNALALPLWVRFFDKKSKTWTSRQFDKVETNVLADLNAGCLGSVTALKSIAGFLILDTHLSPSASCTIVLTPKLEVKRTLYGWVVANSPAGLALIEHSEIHFAPTHPLELSVYDLIKNAVVQIYPPKNTWIRDEYKRILGLNLSMDWCRDNNSHCDPELFDANLTGEPVINDETKSLAFEALFQPRGYGPKAEHSAGERRVVYVYRHQGEDWEFREILREDFAMTLQQAVSAENLTQLFRAQRGKSGYSRE